MVLNIRLQPDIRSLSEVVVTGILQTVTLPASAGIDDGSAPTNNIASVRNNGFEFQLVYTGKAGNNLTYNVSDNLPTVHNQVTGLYCSLAFTTGNDRTEINQPIGYLYGYKFGGIFQNQGEIDTYRILRLAVVLLLQAEPIVQSGGAIADAVALVNQVRTRARNMKSGASSPPTYPQR